MHLIGTVAESHSHAIAYWFQDKKILVNFGRSLLLLATYALLSG